MSHSTLVQYVDNMKALGVAPTLLPSRPKPDPSEEDAEDPSQQNVVKTTAKHVADHVEDPMGSTKEMFEDLGDKQLQYESAKQKARVALAPVKAVLKHADQLHGLEPENEDQAMGYHQPGDPNSNQPQPMPGQSTKPLTPPNMATTPQQMNQGRPSQVGVGKPGVAPGPAQSVRPAKMGMPQPGGGGGNPARPGQSIKPQPGKKNAGRSVKVHIQGASEYGDQELRSKLQEALREYYNSGDGSGDSPVPGMAGCGSISKYPYIEDVFSAGKYIVYNLDGKKYKMNYTVSSKGTVTLTGKPAQVRIAYVEAKADKLSTIMAGVDVGTERILR